MSNAKYMNELISGFESQHSASEGWITQRFTMGLNRVIGPLLPAFLQEQRAMNRSEQQITAEFHYYDNAKARRRSLTNAPFVRRGKGFNDCDWTGRIEFEWEGSPIHWEQRILPGAMGGFSVLSLVAYKNEGVLERLWCELKAYSRRSSKRQKRIFINGEGSIDRPKVPWDHVILPNGMRNDIRETVETFLRSKRHYKSLDLPYRRGILLSGPPGCGKTLTIKAIAANTKVSVHSLPITTDLDDKAIRRAFNYAAGDAPCILLLEDLDKLAESSRVSLSNLLNQLDGLETAEGVLVIATTNHPERLDDALLQRPSRFDRVFHYTLPGFDERLKLLELRAKDRYSKAALEKIARSSGGFTMAYIQETAVSALMLSVHENRKPCDEDLDKSFEKLKKQQKKSSKPDASIKPASSVGFAPNGAAMNKGEGN